MDNVDCYDFRSSGDLQQKISRTVVFVEGSPVYIDGVQTYKREQSILLATFPSGKRGTVLLSQVDYQSPLLGMFYSPFYKCAVETARATTRQYRGGLPLESLRLTEAGNQNAYLSQHGNNLSIIFTDDFVNMLKNNFRSIPSCIKLLKDGAKSVPFRRFHWLKDTLGITTVMFKNRPLIMLDSKGSVVKEFSEDCAVHDHLTRVIPTEIELIKKELSNG